MCGLSALTFVRNRVEDIVRMAFMVCKVSRGHDGNLIATQPILFVHKRKYDETQIPCVVDMPMGDDTGTVTTCSGKHRILVLEGSFGMILRRAAAASGPEFCKIMGGSHATSKPLGATTASVWRSRSRCPRWGRKWRA